MADDCQIFANRYKREQKLGEGNFGSVYCVVDRKTGNPLHTRKALKRLPVHGVSEMEKKDIEKEANIQKELSHPNVVKFFDNFYQNTPNGEMFCMITELCKDGDLADVIRTHTNEAMKIKESQIAEWTVQILLGLNYIHKQKILHRDIKPSNLLLRNMIVKIGDFGISKVLSSTTYMATSLKGTPIYMSPEALLSKGYNSKSDMWSTGCVIYELAALTPLFPARNYVELLDKVSKAKVPSLGDKYSSELHNTIKRCITTQAASRPHALEFLAEPYLSDHTQTLQTTAVQTMQTELANVKAKSAKPESDIGLQRNPDQRKKEANMDDFWKSSEATSGTKAESSKKTKVTARHVVMEVDNNTTMDLRALIDCLKNLSISQESLPSTVSDDSTDGVFTEYTRELKIKMVTIEIKTKLTEKDFKKAHDYLTEARNLSRSGSTQSMSESDILAGLSRMVKDEDTQQMLNSLVFLEAQEGRRRSLFDAMNTV